MIVDARMIRTASGMKRPEYEFVISMKMIEMKGLLKKA